MKHIFVLAIFSVSLLTVGCSNQVAQAQAKADAERKAAAVHDADPQWITPSPDPQLDAYRAEQKLKEEAKAAEAAKAAKEAGRG